ncbi:MAG: hypothetical protein ACIAXF_09705 [Phycisphaerales bacterium JB063]
MNDLYELTAATLEASRVRPGESVGDMPANTTGGTLIRPGGRDCYPSFWVRDFAMSLACGLIPYAEARHALELIARCQQGDTTRHFDTGAKAPPYAIPDHINFDGQAVFYPGTYSSGDDQGGGAWGVRPPIDNHYDFIHIAYHLVQQQPDTPLLQTSVGGMTILDRLCRAFGVPHADDQTGMAVTDDAERAVGFGFCDMVQKTGKLLFCSLLRYRAAGQLAELCRKAGETDAGVRYGALAARIRDHLPSVFAGEEAMGGWLFAATEDCRQADVWGTLYALELGVLPDDVASRARRAVVDALERGTIEYQSAVRHIPTDMDYAGDTAWQRTIARHQTYQNGAYWHTPTGWLINAVRQADAERAEALATAYLDHLRAADFRQGPSYEAPWECFGKDGADQQNPVYLTSVTVPLACLSG